MDGKTLEQLIVSEIAEQGLRIGILDVQQLPAVRKDLERCDREKALDRGFHREWARWFDFTPPKALPEPSSIIIIAIPQPQFEVAFAHRNRKVRVVVPPTYLHAQEVDGKAQDALSRVLSRHGHHAVRARLPVKLLAVKSGLGQYGRNNICYVREMGSFHRMAVFYTDVDAPQQGSAELRVMDACEDCLSCYAGCPTGAITQERVLLHVERCITHHNEKPGDIPFPEWLDPSWHNCLVGCLHCQRVCPMNKDLLDWIEQTTEFSEEETDLLLRGRSAEELPPHTLEKLREADLAEDLDILPRNLSVLLEREK